MVNLDPDEDEEYLRQAALKGKRARRREYNGHDPNRLRAYYDKQGWPQATTLDMFRQLIKAYRHSCHAGCCRWATYVKRADRRQDRHQTKVALAKGYVAYRRKANYISEASYKGT